MFGEIHLAQKLLRTYWERTKDLPPKIKGGIETIQIGPDVPAWCAQEVRRLCEKHRRIFESAKDGCPLPVKGGTCRIDLKPDAKFKRCPEPNWGHGPLRHILTRWAEKQLRSGMFVPAPEARCASRPHIAMKTIRGHAKDSDVFDIRVCGDYVYVNSLTVPLQANAPDVPYQIQKAAGNAAYWYTDGDAQYNERNEHHRDAGKQQRPTPVQFHTQDGKERGDQLRATDDDRCIRRQIPKAGVAEDGLLIVEHAGLPRHLLEQYKAEARNQRTPCREHLSAVDRGTAEQVLD